MKTNELKHTPGPWRVSTITTTNDWLIVNDEIQIARIPDAKSDVEHGESAANAAFIVDACNNYERVKAQVDELRKHLIDCVKWFESRDVQNVWPKNLVYESARAALAKLEDK